MRLRDLLLLFILFVLFGGLAAKAQAPSRKLVILPASASAEEMYATYCASCHGWDGKGVRQAATSAATIPDLTTLAKRNGGRFPLMLVKDAIRGDTRLVAHAHDMPIWGFLFQYVGEGNRAEVDLRIDKLTEYLKSLQAK